MLLRNLQMEAEILRAPDDVAPYLVYADWLGEHSDPLGELIMLQVAGKASAREQLLVRAEIAGAFASTVPDPRVLELHWRHGFVHRIHLRGQDPHVALFPLLDELLSARCCPFVRELAVDVRSFEVHVPTFLEYLARAGKPVLLERLDVGRISVGSRFVSSALFTAFPRLVRATVTGGASLELVSLGTAVSLTLLEGDQYRLDPAGVAIVGRARDAALVFDHPGLNRKNFGIRFEHGQWLFSHYGGSHPIDLNGRRTRAHDLPLTDGDRISPVEGLVLRFVKPPE